MGHFQGLAQMTLTAKRSSRNGRTSPFEELVSKHDVPCVIFQRHLESEREKALLLATGPFSVVFLVSFTGENTIGLESWFVEDPQSATKVAVPKCDWSPR